MGPARWRGRGKSCGASVLAPSAAVRGLVAASGRQNLTALYTQSAAPAGGTRQGVAQWAFGGPLLGATPFDAALVAKLGAAWALRPSGEKPRTRHLKADGSPKYTNRLYLESSPYLRQHDHNPVNWYSLSDEAFETARSLHRPVLLSVGYSTCHLFQVIEEHSLDVE